VQGAAEPEEGGTADRQVKDLSIGEGAAQRIDDLVVDAGVVEGEALRVVDGEPLLLAELTAAGFPDRAVEILFPGPAP